MAKLRRAPKNTPAKLRKELTALHAEHEELKRKLIFDPDSVLVRTRALVLLSRGVGKRRFKSISHIAEDLGATEKQVALLLKGMRIDGYNVKQRGGKVAIVGEYMPSPKKKIKVDMKGGRVYKFGVLSDPHLCSNWERLDVCEAAYDDFARQGVDTVYLVGNMIDGEHRFNMYEIKAHGLADQTYYFLDHYPQRAGIKTLYITGDCHEGWFAQRVGLDVGKYIELFAHDRGRDDLHYLGFMKQDIKLQAERGHCTMRLFHPGGGSSYAMSYKAQKIVEAYSGGEKPQILLLGHFHKSGYFYPRGVKVLLAGCAQDQSTFMEKKSLASHVAYWIVTVQLAPDGSIVRWLPEEVPFYDKKFYNDNAWIEDSGLAT